MQAWVGKFLFESIFILLDPIRMRGTIELLGMRGTIELLEYLRAIIGFRRWRVLE